jgi:hypothetical protein
VLPLDDRLPLKEGEPADDHVEPTRRHKLARRVEVGGEREGDPHAQPLHRGDGGTAYGCVAGSKCGASEGLRLGIEVQEGDGDEPFLVALPRDKRLQLRGEGLPTSGRASGRDVSRACADERASEHGT